MNNPLLETLFDFASSSICAKHININVRMSCSNVKDCDYQIFFIYINYKKKLKF